MNRMHRFLAGVLLLASAQVAAETETCPGFADERLVSLANNIALIAEQIDASMHERSLRLAAEIQRLRDLVGDRDPDALNTLCTLMSRYPSLEPAFADSARLLSQNRMQQWLAQASNPAATRSSFNCLSRSEYQATRSVLSLLLIGDSLLQGACDSLSCYPLACRTCAFTGLVFGLVIPVFEAGIAVDDLNCNTNLYDNMSAYCRDVNGSCRAGRQAGRTLVAIEQAIYSRVLPEIDAISQDVVSGDALDETRALLDSRIERTQNQIATLEDRLSEDADRRRDFQHDLETLDLEAALSVPVATIPVDLQLPAAFGGRLETVREVVADAIVNSQRAGLTVDSALTFLRDGDNLFNAGSYADAFDAYRSAYQELVQ